MDPATGLYRTYGFTEPRAREDGKGRVVIRLAFCVFLSLASLLVAVAADAGGHTALFVAGVVSMLASIAWGAPAL